MFIFFRKVIRGKEFLRLDDRDVGSLISHSDITVQHEEKVSKLQIIFLILCMEYQLKKVGKYTVQ